MKTEKKNLLFPIIKKGLILLSFIFLILTSFSFVKAEELENYDIQFYDNIHFQLENGIYENNVSWSSTNKIAVKNGDVIPILPYCHYIQFYNAMNIYIGYYTVDGTDNTHSTYLGVFNGGAITLEGIKTFVLSINKDGENSYINSYYGNTLTTETFSNVFGNPSYGLYTDSFLNTELDTVFTANDGIMQTRYYLSDFNDDEIADDWDYNDTNTSVSFDRNINSWKITVEVAENRAGFVSLLAFDFIASHKYFIFSNTSTGDSTLTLEFGGVVSVGVDGEDTRIITATTTATGNINLFPTVTEVEGDYYLIYQFVVYDLTLMFGTGNEPSVSTFMNNYFEATAFKSTFGNMQYTITNLNSDTDTEYLAEQTEPYGVSNYAVTRVLPTNLITNGDFSIDSNSDGLADNWSVIYTATPTIVNGFQRATVNALNQNFSINQTVGALTSGNQFYVIASWNKSADMTGNQFLEMTGATTQTIQVNTNANWDTTFSHLFTSSSNNTVIRFYSYLSTQFPVGVWMEIDNVYMYNVSALKTAGLFGGMTDSAIKTVLDDYAVNGLTTSNIHYFFTGTTAWNNLSSSKQNTILNYYGLDFIGGTVTDVTDYRLKAYNLNENDRGLDNLIVVPSYLFNSQDFHKLTNTEVRDFINANTNPEDYENDTFFDTLDIIDTSRYSFKYINDSPFKQYYIQLYRDRLNETERWEWYYWAGVTSLNYDKLFTVYQTLQTIIPITFTDFQTNEVFFLVAPIEEPDDLAPTIDDTLTGLGLSPIVKVIIGLLIISAFFVFIAIKKGNWLYYPLVGYPAFIVFALIGWFAWWLALLFTAVLTFILYMTILK